MHHAGSRMIRNTATEIILRFLQEGAEASVDIFDVFTSGYSESYRKMRSGKSVHFKTDWAYSYREHQCFYTLLNKLKNQGLVERRNSGKNSLWRITKQGLEKLNFIKKTSSPAARYKTEKEDAVKIVIFDIPEERRGKRAWLREALRNLAFKLLQKSVWIGKSKIPEDLIKDLKKQGLLEYVQIFEITKGGSLKKI